MVQKLGRKTLVVMLAIILLILSSTSCSRMLGQNNNKQQGQNEQQQQKKDPPSALTEMEKETDNMIQQIQKVRDQRTQMVRQQMNASQKENNDEQGNQGQQKSNQSGQKQGQQQQGKQQKNQNQDVQQTQLTINWQDFEKRIKAVNELWNNYEPQAKKDGAPDVLISQFEKQLNTLTSTIMARNEEETLVAANGLYQYYPQFFNLYRHKAPPEIKEIKYYLQEIVINAEAGKWEDAAALLENMEKAWQTAKSRMQKPDHELNERIDHAMQDFSQVVKQKDLQLVKIKGEILLKNVEKVK